MSAISRVIMLMSAGNNNNHNNQNRNNNNNHHDKTQTNLAGMDVITAVAYEVNLIASGKDWVMDNRATIHTCGDPSQFSS